MFSLTPGRAAQNLGQPGHCGPCRLQAFSLQPSRASEGCKSLRKHCRGSDCLTLSGCKGHSSSLGPGQGAQDQATTPFSSLVKAFCLSASLLPSEKGVWVRIFPKILMTDIVTVSKDCSHTHTHTHTHNFAQNLLVTFITRFIMAHQVKNFLTSIAAFLPGAMAHACNPSYSGGRAGGIELQSQLGQIVHETLS
jgi:hypothetical protein